MGRVLAKRLAAGRSVAAGELDEMIPNHRLKDWFAERLRRLRERKRLRSRASSGSPARSASIIK